MGHKKLRWIVIGGLIAVFIFVAFLQKESPEASFTEPATVEGITLPTRTPNTNVGLQPAAQPNDSQSAPALTEPETEIHIVQPGETLFSISQKYNVDIEVVAQINQILDPSQIMAGQEIKIPDAKEGVVENSAISATAYPIPEPTLQPTDFPANNPNSINNIATNAIINLSPETRQHIDEIYVRGQEIGRNPNAFSKLGDSTIMSPGLLVQFDQEAYNLGDFAYLQVIIDQYTGSFERYGAATHVGLHSWTVFDPMIADNSWCLGNENVLACELRLHNPSIIFIRLGSNDAGIPESFDQHTREVVQYAIDNGVIPIIGTKADRFEGEDNINNQILRQIAADYNVPLWDFDLLAATLPGRGLDPEDNVHINKATVTSDYTQPAAFQSGQAMQDLSAILMLHSIWEEINN